MKSLNILLLGWDFRYSETTEQETNCFSLAQALAGNADLTLILPKADSEFVLQNMQVTGLNKVDLKALHPASRQSYIQPFAATQNHQQEISLYGSPVLMPNDARIFKNQPIPITNASKTPAYSGQSKQMAESSGENANVFDQPDWDNLPIDTQIIQYARFATQLATNQAFDLIYAHNWLTFLAGNELKLVTGKPLALQVNSLFQERSNTQDQGWMYELEKLAIQRCDFLFTSFRQKANTIAETYHIPPDKIMVLPDNNLFTPSAINKGDSSNNSLFSTSSQLEQYEPEYWNKTAARLLKTLQQVVSSR